MNLQTHWRRYATLIAVILFACLSIYRMLNPVVGSSSAIALVLGTSTILFIFFENTRQHTLVQIREQRRNLRPYPTILTVLSTGLIIFLITYLTAYSLMFATYFLRRSDILTTLFFEIIQQIRLIESVHPFTLATIYFGFATIMVIGVLIIYPVLPLKEQNAAIVAFLMTWAYTLAGAYLAVPVIHSLTLGALVLDAALIAIWAVLFDHMYGNPLLPKWFLKKIGKKEHLDV